MTLYYQWHLQGEEQLTVNDLPLRSILDIEGHRFILMAKNHEGHPSNSATLLLEKLETEIEFGDTSNYKNSSVRAYLIGDWLNNFSNKKLFLDVTFKTKNDTDDTYYELTDKFFLLSHSEVDNIEDETEGSNIGFTGDRDRVASILETNEAWIWYSRTNDGADLIIITHAGNTRAVSMSLANSLQAFARPACCISLDNKVTKNDDGSYSVVVPEPAHITFDIIDNTGGVTPSVYSYRAEDRMTWEEWINSDYPSEVNSKITAFLVVL